MKALTQDSTGAFPGSIADEIMFVYVVFLGWFLQAHPCRHEGVVPSYGTAILWDTVGGDREDGGVSLQWHRGGFTVP